MIQCIQILGVLLPLFSSLKHLFQLNNNKIYIKVFVLIILTALSDISLAKNANYSGSNDSAAIKNPYKPNDYLSKLASELTPEQRDLLLGKQGLTTEQAKKNQPSMLNNETTEKRSSLGVERRSSLEAEKRSSLEVERRSSLETETSWSLGEDLDKYRDYSVKEGSRFPEESLNKLFLQTGFLFEDGINIFTLGYGSDRGLPFCGNDGADPLWQAQIVLQQLGQVISNILDGAYSIVDLATLDSLDDLPKNVYKDNNAIVRPFIFIGKTIGNSFAATVNTGNTLTWGYFDNVVGPAGMCVEDVIECLKHSGQAVTNLPRALIFVDADEDTQNSLDWILVVPWELASNIIEMKGISNAQRYRTAFREKGVIGSILEMSGSTYIVYRVIDEKFDLHEKFQKKDKKSSNGNGGGQGGGGNGEQGGDIDGGAGGESGSYYIFIDPETGQIIEIYYF